MATSRLPGRVDEGKSVVTMQLLEAIRQGLANAPEHSSAPAAPYVHLSCWQHGGKGNCQWCGAGANHGALLVTDALKVFLCRDCAARFRALLVGGGEAQR